MKEEVCISTKKLAIGYSNKKSNNSIIEDITIDIPKGKLTAVIGLNGSGKSTLIRTLAKQQPQLKGEFILNKKPANLYSKNEWAKKVSWVQTNTETVLNITVEEFISLGRQPYTNWLDSLSKTDLNIINKTIANCNLSKLRKKKCTELSDGQLQNVTIARALVQDTDVIILDEPTTHLDVVSKIKVLSLLKELCASTDKTIIFTTHEIEFTLQSADYILAIFNEKVSINTTHATIENDILNKLFKTKELIFNKECKRFIIG